MPANPITRRLALPGWSVLRFSLTLVAGALLAAAIVTGVFVIFWIGIPVAVAVLLAIRFWANTQRRIIGEQLGITIPAPYRPRAKGRIDQQALWLIREAATWRDFAWLAIDATLGFLVNLLYLGVFSVAVYYLVQPVLLVTVFRSAQSPFVNDFGFYDFDTPAKTLMLVPLALACGVAWWRWGELFLRWYSHLGVLLLGPTSKALLTARVSELRQARDQTADHAAAELRRIERDLHDGAQARIAALSLTLGMAEELLQHGRPDQAAALVGEARQACSDALEEIRQLVRGIHPPVLADRGFTGALQAMALDHPLPVSVVDRLADKLPAPLEAAAYFATNEVLTNITKHAEAGQVQVVVGRFGQKVVIEVRDDGVGGATFAPGGGLDGVRRRLAAFDGTVEVDSPPGGPTTVTMTMPAVVVDVRGADN
ncbi:sensor domain-containing protein [Glycomyces sp. TRM65418]|uniref:sensor histidine kinase n=1 Tax=Glycomyces sp. TRM65418 TaxID=2867006 RepID=UPI001CE6516B|nr:sensor domain-containing protein [Glycomyces sp. TRM65418]MCC3761855.1 sensor domain-containing protein [Glycomyces sp. TRM65418]QZD55936.1 sensor domain-containing protein [Glycomyces sp. TRM65418]